MFYPVKIQLGLDVSKRMLPGSSLAQGVEERPVKKVLGILFFNNGVWISLIFDAQKRYIECRNFT